MDMEKEAKRVAYSKTIKVESEILGNLIFHNTHSPLVRDKKIAEGINLPIIRETAEQVRSRMREGAEIRKRSGELWSKRDLERLGAQDSIDLLLIGKKVFYVGEIKGTNTLINTSQDIEYFNIDFGSIIDISNRDIVNAQIERLSIGDKDNYDKINFNEGSFSVDGLRLVDKTNRSVGLFASIPANTIPLNVSSKFMNKMVYAQQLIRDFVLTKVEASQMGQSSKFREMAFHIHTKDVANTYMKNMLGIEKREEMQEIQSIIRTEAGLGALSGMTLKLQLGISKVVKTKNPEEYPDYSEISGDCLREIIRFVEFSVPITPEILINIRGALTSYAQDMIINIINFYNSSMNPDLEMLDSDFDLEVEKHYLANITQDELDDFQNIRLPKLIEKAGKKYSKIKKRKAQEKFAKGDDDFEDYDS
jgi:hypothetical protein